MEGDGLGHRAGDLAGIDCTKGKHKDNSTGHLADLQADRVTSAKLSIKPRRASARHSCRDGAHASIRRSAVCGTVR